MKTSEKIKDVLFILVALIGTAAGWLPGGWAILMALIGSVGVSKWLFKKWNYNG